MSVFEKLISEFATIVGADDIEKSEWLKQGCPDFGCFVYFGVQNYTELYTFDKKSH